MKGDASGEGDGSDQSDSGLEGTGNSNNLIVSVVVPAFNAENHIRGCLEALLNQSQPAESFEIIVVDDGSTDQTGEIIRSFPVSYFHQENQGPAAARNRGAGQARGEVILFTDSDCVPEPDWIVEMLKPFQNPEVAAVKGAYITRQREWVARFSQLEFEERFEMLSGVEAIDMVDTYSAGFRREIFQGMKGFDISFPVANNEDTELSYRMVAAGHRMVFNPKAVVAHLNHPNSAWGYYKLKFGRGYWRMVVYRRFPDKMLKDTYTPKALKLQVLFLGALLGTLPLWWLFPHWGWLVPALFSLPLLLLILPFSITALKKDFPAGLITPFMLLVRAGAIGGGVFWALLRAKKA
ncbi:MAG: glycosyltransferase [Magnetococcales bacterium]|nr:glycosyltransferase [Magnetococcales bacterium]